MDVLEGRGPSPSLVTLLIKRLPDTSLTTALASGGREFFGWGVDRHLRADLYDALNLNTRATGNWKKPPKLPSWPRPTRKKKKQKNAGPVTVKSLWASLTSGK